MSLTICPVDFADACLFVEQHHRHHKAPQGHKFSIGCARGYTELVGVAIIGRPVSRVLDDGGTLEVTRVATDGTAHACSALYAAAWRAARAMGYRRMITYTLAAESGTSLTAAGWRVVGQTKGGSWNTPARARTETAAELRGQKRLWEAAAPLSK